MAVASLVVRLSAQVAEFQRSFEEATRSASSFERKYAGIASNVAEQQNKINRAFASFAGDHIISEASALAAALHKVGGAAKLTEAEQRRVNSTVTEAIAKYQALGQTAPKALTDLARATANVKPIPNPFGGSDVLRQANEYVAAVGRIGGASKLTETEQRRVNTAITEALAKYAALGKAAPQSLVNLANATKQVAAATQQIKAVPNPFGGTEVLRQANDYVAAVGRIGGASRLTEQEQRKVNAAVTEAIAKYAALGKSAPQSLLAIANATKQIVPPATLAGGAMGVLSSAFGQFTAANLAASAIQSVIGKLSDFVAQGQKLPGLSASFEKLTGTVGQSSSEMLAAMQSSTRGLVTNIDLMQSANKAILLGLPVTTKEMGELARTATVLGKAMGQDATKSLDDLITALGRSSPLILDNLGLTVKVGEANEAYAAKLGKTVQQLTDAESKMAFYEAAMEAARRKTAELGDQTKTLGEIIESAWVSVGNVVTATVATINVGVGRALSSGREFGQFAQDIITLGFAAAALNAQLRENAAAAGSGKPKLTPKQVAFDEAFNQAAALQALEREVKSLTAALAPLTEKQRELASQMARGGLSAQSIAEKLNKVAATAGVTERQIQPLVDAFKKTTKEGTSYADLMKKIAASSKPLSQIQQDQARDLIKAGFGFNDVAKAIRATEIQVKNFAEEEKTLNDIIKQQIALLPRLKNQFDAMNQASGFINQIPDVPRSSLMSPIVEALKRDFATIDFASVDAQAAIDRVKKGIQDAIDADPPSNWDKFIGSFDFVAGALDSLARAFDNAFGRILDGAAAVVSGIDDIARATTNLGKLSGAIELGAKIGKMLQPLLGLNRGLLGRLLGTNNQGRNNVEDFAESLGGFDKLHKKLQEATPDAERLWKQLTQLNNAWDTEEAARAIGEVQKVLEDFGTEAERAAKRMAGLGKAVEGVNKKAELFADPFRKMLDAMKGAKESGEGDADAIARNLMAAAQAGQAEFERLGQFVAGTFAGIVKETGDAFGAIQSLKLAFDVIRQGVNEFGLTTNGTIDSLLEMFALVEDAVFGPILQSIQATGQIFTGLQESGHLTADLFQQVATDIGASFRDIEAKGGDVAKAMALSQPILQKLWEGQQIYGAVTDETTAALLRQAEEQGLVGAHMKDVNQKILDVLIIIAETFGATIPNALKWIPPVAKEVAEGVSSEFDKMYKGITGGTKQMKDEARRDFEIFQNEAKLAAEETQRRFDRLDLELKIPIIYDDPGFTPRIKSGLRVDEDGGPELIALARGGIVRKPTLALVGEAGPEAVIPLSQYNRSGGGSSVSPSGGSVVFQRGAFEGVVVDSDERVEQLAERIFSAVEKGGRIRTRAQRSLGVG